MFADCPNLCLCISVVNTHESDTVYLYSFCKKQAVALIQHHSNNQTASEKKKHFLRSMLANITSEQARLISENVPE